MFGQHSPMTARVLHTLFLLTALACGAPGSDSVFTQGNPKLANKDSIGRASQPSQAREPPKTYKGLYRRVGSESRFQPCGTTVPLDVDGNWNGLFMLREQFRWSSAFQGQKLFGVVSGWILHDTVRTGSGAGDSASSGIPRTRFYLINLDSLRPWNDRDCPGMKVSP